MATFIGLPAMNLIPLDYLHTNGGGDTAKALLHDLPKGTDIVGICPDDLRMRAPSEPHLVVESNLELFEAAGAESHLYVRLAGSDQPTVIRIAGQPPVAEGETLRFHVTREALHPFNRGSGKRTGDHG
ncbi:TOBE domain-containing protein [Halomonas sp. RA08-2]|uniref:TOBE domain-containing protein n=1 Tax=Halomonas sp. RA08-2 TaxID=3440842 RepID=UPI003EEEB855